MPLIYEFQNLDNPQINFFYNSFHNSQRNNQEFEWEFKNNPAGEAIYIHAKNEVGDVAGALSVIPFMMVSDAGESILTGKPEDTMVNIFERLKNKNEDVLKKMYDLIEEKSRNRGIKILWGFTYASKSFSRLGFEVPFKTYQGICVLNIKKAFKHLCALNPENKFLNKAKIFALVLASKSFELLTLNKGKILIYSNNDFSNHNELLLNHLGKSSYTLFQDEEFMKWRILQNPNKINFKTYSYINLKGFKEFECIVSIRDNVAFLEQILLHRDLSDKMKIHHISGIIRLLKKEGIVLIRFMGFNNNAGNKTELQLLKKSKFIFLKRGIPFIFKNISDLKIDPDQIFLSRLFTQGNL